MRKNSIILKVENTLRFTYKIALMFFYFYFAMYARNNNLPTYDLPEYALFLIPTFLGMYVLVALLWYDMGVREIFLELYEDG